MQNKNVLVVASHPDDEILGCGATIAKLQKEGWSITTLLMAEGITSRQGARNLEENKSALQKLHNTAIQANKIVGVKDVHLANLPDNRMDSVDLLDVVKLIEEHYLRIKPSLIFTHHRSDLNIDHKITNMAVLTAARPLPGLQTDILFFEVPSATGWDFSGEPNQFIPNLYYSVGETLDSKVEALKIYADEMRPFPHARSIEAVRHLAHYRGSQIGVTAAEAFSVGRIIR